MCRIVGIFLILLCCSNFGYSQATAMLKFGNSYMNITKQTPFSNIASPDLWLCYFIFIYFKHRG